MRTVGRWLVAGWLLTALGVLASTAVCPDFRPRLHRSRCWRSHLLRWYASSVRHRSWTDPSAATLPGGDANRRPLAEVVAVANKKPALDCGRHQMIERPGLSATPLSQGR